MVVLNLRDDCVARAATNFRRGMTDKRFLELEITAWLGSKERKRQLAGEAYYDGAQDVLRRKRIALDDDGKVKVLDHLPNNRLVNNIYAKMVDQKTNYSFGRPFSFDTENKAYAAALSTVFGSRFQRTMQSSLRSSVGRCPMQSPICSAECPATSALVHTAIGTHATGPTPGCWRKRPLPTCLPLNSMLTATL